VCLCRNTCREKDLADYDAVTQPIPLIRMEEADAVGLHIRNGETAVISLSANAAYLFASAMDGNLSDAIVIKDRTKPEVNMIAKLDLTKVSCPRHVRT
jgi:hypothetical protein